MLAVRLGVEGGIHRYALPLNYPLVQFCANAHMSNCSSAGAAALHATPVPVQGYTGTTG